MTNKIKNAIKETKMNFGKLFLILLWIICIILSIINRTDFCLPLAGTATVVYLLIRD